MTQKKKAYDIPIDSAEEPVLDTEVVEEFMDAEEAPEPSRESPASALDHLQRLQAEFANYRRRVDKERGETVVWAQSQLVEKLLPVLDALDRASATVGDDDSPAAKGLLMIREKFERTLVEAGLQRLEALGQTFDPSLHEALLTQPVEADQAGQVLMEIEPGYYFRSRLVRPARVQVGVENDA